MQIIHRAVDLFSETTLPALLIATSTRQMFNAATPNLFWNQEVNFATFVLLQRSLFFHLTPRLKLCGMSFDENNLPELLRDHLPHIQQFVILRATVTNAFVESTVMRMPNLTEFYSYDCWPFAPKSVVTLLDHPNGPMVAFNFCKVSFGGFGKHRSRRELLVNHDIAPKLLSILDKRDHGRQTLEIWRSALELLSECFLAVDLSERPLSMFFGMLQRCATFLDVREMRESCVVAFGEVVFDQAGTFSIRSDMTEHLAAFDAILVSFVEAASHDLQDDRARLADVDNKERWLFSPFVEVFHSVEEIFTRAHFLEAVESFLCACSPAELVKRTKHRHTAVEVLWSYINFRCYRELSVPESVIVLAAKQRETFLDTVLEYFTSPAMTWRARMQRLNFVMSIDGFRDSLLEVIASALEMRNKTERELIARSVESLVKLHAHINRKRRGLVVRPNAQGTLRDTTVPSEEEAAVYRTAYANLVNIVTDERFCKVASLETNQ